jgi:UDP-glucose 4-epimerase
MKTILVTGGAGYIGSHTILELLKEGSEECEVLILDDFSNSNPLVVNKLNKMVKNVKLYVRDCRDNIDDILSTHKVDGVIHFAASKAVGESVQNPLEYYDNNINSLLNILDACKRFDIKSLVFSSSCSLYGDVDKLPVNEETKLSDPQSPYAYSKLVGERIISDFCNSNPNISVISLRYFNPVGAHESGEIGEYPITKPNNILPVICNSADTGEEMVVFGDTYNTRDGSCIRDYIHVSDIARAHVDSLNYMSVNSNICDVINLGSGDGVSVLELIKTFEEVNGVKVNYKIGEPREGDVIQIYSDSSKAKEVLGWSPIYDIKDMVSSAWKWHKNL